MPVKIIRAVEHQINEFLNTPGIRVTSRHIIPRDIPEIAIFYEAPEDDAAVRSRVLIEQNAQLECLIDLAKQVAKDEKYTGLKNSSQRQIYLLAKYNLPANDAATVSELLKPELASLLGGE